MVEYCSLQYCDHDKVNEYLWLVIWDCLHLIVARVLSSCAS